MRCERGTIRNTSSSRSTQRSRLKSPPDTSGHMRRPEFLSVQYDSSCDARCTICAGNARPVNRCIMAKCDGILPVRPDTSKTRSPSNSSKIMHPTLHMSHGNVHSKPRHTSGARYCTVCTREPGGPPSHVAQPKSINFTLTFASSNIIPGRAKQRFSVFRSAWMSLLLHRNWRASHSWKARRRAAPTDTPGRPDPFDRKSLKAECRFVPRSSVTRQKCP
mmetsp:Transcript_85690/g.138956  ORF Transcript_85690/g.138956 Transcript_85690/m.138956 type:complete len:219 (+) Transcript_85690:251-907(+)